AWALSIALLATGGLLWPQGSQTAGVVFSDIQNTPYKTSIEFLSERGIVEGYPDGTFGPDRKINRAEILKIVLGASVKGDIGSTLNCFPDVRFEWFAKYVCYALEQGIVKGYPDGKFKPAQNVNMAEALKMGIESFPVTVGAANTPWYQKYIDFAHDNNIFSRYSVSPQKDMTRGEMAYLIHQLILNDEGTQKFTGVRDSGSIGCGKTPPAHAPVSFTVGGKTRHAIVDIPSGYDQDKPIPLVFAFHGRTNPNTMVKTYYKVEEASKGGAIFIYPAGLPEEGPSRTWSDPGDKSDKLRDFALFDALLKEFSESYCIDQDRVYVVGHSLGAWFTNSLACARGDKIRAIGSVGGGTTLNACAGPVAAMIMHNPKDNLAPFSSGEVARDQLVKQNQCATKTVPVEPRDLNCVAYQGCNSTAPVVWCPHNDSSEWGGAYYPHTWPDHAGSEIWKFFEGLE
ncbi:S-layer homology domain-containing protein, partial [Candidatus Peregrinibacteria bacterium]|nr:S-layer homology domain-containing protein [Candidatus Peregrinibacteria bacterium]